MFSLRPDLKASVLAIAAISLALTCSMAGSHTARAHGEFEESNPRANTVVTKTPTEVVLHMSDAHDAAFSEIKMIQTQLQRNQTQGNLRRWV